MKLRDMFLFFALVTLSAATVLAQDLGGVLPGAGDVPGDAFSGGEYGGGSKWGNVTPGRTGRDLLPGNLAEGIVGGVASGKAAGLIRELMGNNEEGAWTADHGNQNLERAASSGGSGNGGGAGAGLGRGPQGELAEGVEPEDLGPSGESDGAEDELALAGDSADRADTSTPEERQQGDDGLQNRARLTTDGREFSEF